MQPEHHISSLLVHARPDRAPAVDAFIRAMAGAEVHAVSPEGKLVVTLETEGTGQVSDAIAMINGLDGVLSAVLVFHYIDSDQE